MAAGNSWLDWDSAHLALSRLEVDHDEPSLPRALEQTAMLAVHMLDVDRVGVWLVDADSRQLKCIFQFDRVPSDEDVHVLGEMDLGAYRDAMDEHRFIVADDAQSHPFTRDLSERYLIPLGITSMLDAPIYRGGELVGVVCHEHRGEKRHWSKDERYFAGSVANVASLFMEQHARMAVEAELHQKEAALQRAVRLNNVARLAAGVAHDFNNLLTVILAMADRGMARSQSTESREAFREIHDAAGRASRLAERLLRFGRGGPPSKRSAAPDRVVAGVLRLLRSVARKTTIGTDLGAEDALVSADSIQLEQMLINLVTNAAEAGSRQIVIRTRRDGESLLLEVEDDGEGMPDEVKAQAFEPLFTTKESGSGLGLPSVVGLAESVGGDVTIDSAPGRGTTVRIRLPLAGSG